MFSVCQVVFERKFWKGKKGHQMRELKIGETRKPEVPARRKHRGNEVMKQQQYPLPQKPATTSLFVTADGGVVYFSLSKYIVPFDLLR